MNQGEPIYQLVLPSKFRDMALEGLHDLVGQMGMDRMLDLVRTRLYWLRMFINVSMKDVSIVRPRLRKLLTL